MEQRLENFTSGPYQVDFNKPYKPIFICFLDLIFGITFFYGSLLYYWEMIPDEYSWEDYQGFVPAYMSY